MSMSPGDATQWQGALSQAVRTHWKLFLAEGIILVVLGLLAIVVPPLATIGVTIFIGWLFVISGVAGLITTFGARHAPGFWWSLFSAILGIAAGVVLLGWPISGAVSLTLLLIVFFIIEGVLSIMYALEHKRELTGQWGWRHQLVVPGQDGVRPGHIGHLAENSAAQSMADLGERGSFGVGELQPPFQLGFQDAIFGGQIFIPRQQLLVHRPRGEGQDAHPVHLSSAPADSRFDCL